MGFQLLVKDLGGRTRCLQLKSGAVTVDHVLEQLHPATIPAQVHSGINLHEGELYPGINLPEEESYPGSNLQDLLLYTGTKVLSPGDVLVVESDGQFPFCHVSGRLLGGKGGFGSLLRGAASKAGTKKTSNFDACRDMSGRRLRHVNAEKKLKDWRHEAKERQLEKVAQDYIKNLAKERKKAKEAVVVAGDIKQKSVETMDRVAESVQLGIKQSQKLSALQSKRRRAALAEAGGDLEEAERGTKKRTLLEKELLGAIGEMDEDEEEGGEGEEEEEEEEDEDEEEEEDEEESDSDDIVDGVGPMNLPGGPKEVNGTEEVNGSGVRGSLKDKARAEVVALVSSSDEGSPSPPSSFVPVAPPPPPPPVAALSTESGGPSRIPSNCGAAPITTLGQVGAANEVASVAATPEIAELDWDKITSAADLEALGLEVLKKHLADAGLKCGGTLQERASRLFLLKKTPVGKLDKKHFARPPQRKH